MARLWSSGAELQSVTNAIEFSTISTSGGGAVAISTTTKRTGDASVRFSNAGTAGVAHFNLQFVTADANGPYYLRGYFNFTDNTPSAICTIFGFVDSANTNTYGRIRLATNGSLELWDNSAKIGSSSSILSTGTWYRIELYFYNNTGTGKVELDAKIDGTTFASTTTSTVTGQVAMASIGDRSGTTSYDFYADDMALNDSTGSFQNSFPGEGGIIHLRPNATGDNGDWTAGSGGDTGDYQDVDDITPNDTTDFLTANTLDQIEDMNITDTPASMNSYDDINCVQIGVRFRIINATDPDPNACVRIKASAGGTVEESGNLGNAGTVWVTNSPTSAKTYPLTLYDLPGASTTAWTKADLDTAQIGVRETATDATGFNVTTMWLLVDYKTGTPSATTVKNLAALGVG